LRLTTVGTFFEPRWGELNRALPPMRVLKEVHSLWKVNGVETGVFGQK
jgi:hypothetical protein